MAATWGKSLSDTASNSISTNSQSNIGNALLQYQFRKLSFNSGYSRLQQSFSASGTKPETISSVYFGVSRWFNFF
jgi:hypothetical protein